MPDRFRGRVVSTEGIKYKIKTLEGQRIHGSFTAYLKKRMPAFPEGTLVEFELRTAMTTGNPYAVEVKKISEQATADNNAVVAPVQDGTAPEGGEIEAAVENREEERQALSVSQVLRYIRDALIHDPRLMNICVDGEMLDHNKGKANAGGNRNGNAVEDDKAYEDEDYWFFRIRDTVSEEEGSINCLMSTSYQRHISREMLQIYRKRFKAGDKVRIIGSITFGKKYGNALLKVDSIEFVGEGAYLYELKLLGQKLEREGVFSKSELARTPEYPFHIALLSRLGMDGYKDCKKTILSRWPAIVEGINIPLSGDDEAAEEIIRNLKETDDRGFDLMVLVRGGGSSEDMKIFNREDISRAVHALKTPIIIGIGHSADVCFAERAADRRAITPTAAGELATPHRMEDVLSDLSQMAEFMHSLIENNVKRSTDAIERCRLEMTQKPQSYIEGFHRSLQKQVQARRSRAAEDLLNGENDCKTTARNIQLKSQKSIDDVSLNLHRNSPEITISRFRSETAKFSADMKAGAEKAQIRWADSLKNYSSEMRMEVENQRQMLEKSLMEMTGQLDDRSPSALMKRGYSVTEADGRVVRSVSSISGGDEITTLVTDGKFTSVVRLE